MQNFWLIYLIVPLTTILPLLVVLTNPHCFVPFTVVTFTLSQAFQLHSYPTIVSIRSHCSWTTWPRGQTSLVNKKSRDTTTLHPAHPNETNVACICQSCILLMPRSSKSMIEVGWREESIYQFELMPKIGRVNITKWIMFATIASWKWWFVRHYDPSSISNLGFWSLDHTQIVTKHMDHPQ